MASAAALRICNTTTVQTTRQNTDRTTERTSGLTGLLNVEQELRSGSVLTGLTGLFKMFLLLSFCCFLKVSTQEVGHREEEDMQHRSLGWSSEQGQLRTKASVYGLWRYTTTPRSEPCLGLLGFHVLHVGSTNTPCTSTLSPCC
ncbi:hypothetical protein ILYODFUR_027880 [Ilyodon furcidens]|uniref:Uncharacterized protein n=1 Tax=Ilyodon furcidens TaxID=33524 RepID=A0ABV0TZD3_9TELE